MSTSEDEYGLCHPETSAFSAYRWLGTTVLLLYSCGVQHKAPGLVSSRDGLFFSCLTDTLALNNQLYIRISH